MYFYNYLLFVVVVVAVGVREKERDITVEFLLFSHLDTGTRDQTQQQECLLLSPLAVPVHLV